MSKVTARRGVERLKSFFSVLSKDLEDVSKAGPHGFAVERLLSRMRKRAKLGASQTLRAQAVADFVATNESLQDFTCSLDQQVEADARHFITIVLERFTASINDLALQETLDMEYLFSLWKFGPGASNGVKGTHTVEKIVQDMTCTESCVPLIKKLRAKNLYFSLFDSERGSSGICVVKGSRLTTVPKNEDTERTIAIEPSGNMCLQLAAGTYLEQALRHIGLDIRTQQAKNKLSARRGSVTGLIATLDMKSASDMISIDLVRRLLPSRWFDLLMTLRSPEIKLPDGRSVKLNMISTMGNGFTFPLMTLIISALIYATRAQRPSSPNLFIDWTDTCVFGDDVIIYTDEVDAVINVLTGAGFLINFEKSFRDGPFRESCGGDYYEGVDVTPFYVRSLGNDSEVYVAINQLMEWCARHSCLCYHSILLLRSFIDGKVFLVPEWHNPDSGVLTARVGRRYKYLRSDPLRIGVRKDHPFLVSLACGGYISSSKLHAFYSPRPYKKVQAKVKNARLPQGYLDGSDPIKRARSITDYVSAYTFLFG